MGCGASSKKAEANKAEGTSSGTEGNKDKGKATDGNDRDQDKHKAKAENKDFTIIMQFLSKVPLFQRLPKDNYPELAAACKNVDFKEGDTIIKQGDQGNEFYIISAGSASVQVTTEGTTTKVATLKEGDYFGETALLRDEPRAATIIADSSLKALKITREKFLELNLNDKLIFANRKAVGGGGKVKVITKTPDEKTDTEKQLIGDALRANENLQTMVNLDQDRVDAMIKVAWKENVSGGADLIVEGDLVADYFYIVQSGSFEIFVAELDSQSQSLADALNTGGKFVSTVSRGGSFGELALLYLVPRAATVRAKEDSIVWVIDRVNFKEIMMKVSEQKIAQYVEHLNQVEILKLLLKEEKTCLAKALVEMHFTKEEIVLQENETGNTFYILYEGEIEISKGGAILNKQKANPATKTAHFFGERALLNGEPRAATVKVVSESAKALALDRAAFDDLLGPLKDILTRDGSEPKSQEGQKNKGPASSNPNDKPREKILRKELVKIGLLGCGGFGAVELYEHKTTKETYAMKGLSKGYIVKTGMQESVMNEKNILMMTNSPFIIRLWDTYNGTQTLYFLLEPALGGELYATYNRKGFHGSEKHAKFYVAGTCEGFAHMHQRRIIYRDLKPENLLLNDVGQLKITDMGLAKFVIGKTYTTCGTPDYFAPELIASIGHTNAVDWWTLGILIFELMSGHPPFESAYPMQIYSKVMKGINKVQFPPKCQGPVGDLIKSLLKKEPSERLPMRPGGIDNLRKSEWFKSFDWESLQTLTLEPPYKPVVKSKKDIANFSARKEDMPRQIEYVDDGTGWDKDFAS